MFIIGLLLRPQNHLHTFQPLQQDHRMFFHHKILKARYQCLYREDLSRDQQLLVGLEEVEDLLVGLFTN